MSKFIPYILKTLWRHRTRHAADRQRRGGGAVRVLLRGGDRRGARSAGRQCGQRADADRLPGQPLLPLHQRAAGGLRAARFGKLAGVADVVPIKVYTNNCRASLDVVVFHGIPPDKLRRLAI